MSIKFIFMALTYNVWPSIAIVAIFFGSTKLKHTHRKGTTNDTDRERKGECETEKGRINDKDRNIYGRSWNQMQLAAAAAAPAEKRPYY